MSEEIKKTRRPRRTKKGVEQDVLDAVTSVIEEVGFTKVTLKEIIQRAKIEASVFYRRYNKLDDLFDDYTRKYDYWFGSVSIMIPKNLNDEEAFKWIIQNLAKELYKNKIMQKILIWELCDENPVTRRTAVQRETLNTSLIQLLEQRFAGSGLDINVLTALTISGVYYLILHQHISKFCDVDFSTREGKKRLDKSLDQLVSLFFSEAKHQQEKRNIAQRLLDA
ncbi:MAG: TetR/AcrR family transcriptional regulator, partial [Paludibacter sp.]|nr:TetR/AcrR family transcriptional regulator [Paludibacter sp.]